MSDEVEEEPGGWPVFELRPVHPDRGWVPGGLKTVRKKVLAAGWQAKTFHSQLYLWRAGQHRAFWLHYRYTLVAAPPGRALARIMWIFDAPAKPLGELDRPPVDEAKFVQKARILNPYLFGIRGAKVPQADIDTLLVLGR